MSSPDRFSADPRYDVYRRGGSTEPRPATPSGPPGGQEVAGREDASPAPRSPDPSPAPPAAPPSDGSSTPQYSEHPGRSDPGRYAVPAPAGNARAERGSIIRELGPEAPPRENEVPGRNPFDPWIWGVAALFIALGVFLACSPILFAEQIQEQARSGYYASHWSTYLSFYSIPLLLLGIGTAVAQLFVLSSRHARRTR